MDDLVVPPFMEPPYIFLFDGIWCDIWMIPNMEDPELVNCEWLMEILKKYNDKPLEKMVPNSKTNPYDNDHDHYHIGFSINGESQ